MTLNGVKFMQRQDEIGSLEVGKFADMIILDRNLFEIEVSSIDGTRVMQTILGGKVVYDRDD